MSIKSAFFELNIKRFNNSLLASARLLRGFNTSKNFPFLLEQWIKMSVLMAKSRKWLRKPNKKIVSKILKKPRSMMNYGSSSNRSRLQAKLST